MVSEFSFDESDDPEFEDDGDSAYAVYHYLISTLIQVLFLLKLTLLRTLMCPPSNVDYLFGLDKVVAPPLHHPYFVAVEFHDFIPEPVAPPPKYQSHGAKGRRVPHIVLMDLKHGTMDSVSSSFFGQISNPNMGGQWGNQIGSKFWEVICDKHVIDPTGK
ncbi:hypothetical protein RJT34_23273 [Clitoria ternatea]|uniref:Uncharacterized protein n=1 Tax=Clitoria ternatea TaxID=43366 RepID=A0AAN9FKR5_CLITE